MTTLQRLLRSNREAILALAQRYGARNVRIFGSAARGDDHPDSDIDVLVDLEPGRSLLDQTGLWLDLQELLGRRVDLVVEGGISPYMEKGILAEARQL